MAHIPHFFLLVKLKLDLTIWKLFTYPLSHQEGGRKTNGAMSAKNLEAKRRRRSPPCQDKMANISILFVLTSIEYLTTFGPCCAKTEKIMQKKLIVKNSILFFFSSSSKVYAFLIISEERVEDGRSPYEIHIRN